MPDSKRMFRARFFATFLMICLLATAFIAFSATAAVDFTGSVVTTDNTGAPKTTFIRGESVYANVELMYQGAPNNQYVTVSLIRTTDGTIMSHYHAWTNNPDVGWNNGSVSGFNLWSGAFFDNDMMTYDVVVTLGAEEIARAPIVVINTGIWLQPDTMSYYPGEQVSISLGTSHTTDVFYVQIINETGATMANWTGQIALTGQWSTTWTIPADFPDGFFTVQVRDAATHAIWDSTSLSVQKFVLLALSDRDHLLPGESAHISYVVIDLATMSPSTGVTVNYSARWINDTGMDNWMNGTLVGSEGVHTYTIPSDIALYSDTMITYWANETTGTRSAQSTLSLVTSLLQATIEVDSGPYAPGEEVVVRVMASAEGDALIGADVDISVKKNGTTIPGYGAADMITSSDGYATHRFVLSADAAQGAYIVTATVSKAGQTATRMTVFNVEWFGDLIITLDKASYHSGETVVAEFRTVWNGQDVPDAKVFYAVLMSSGMLITGSTTTGMASFVIPMTEYGYIYVEAAATIDGYQLNEWTAVAVTIADLVVSPVNEQYSPLDRIVFNYRIATMLTSASLRYTITDADGLTVASANLPFSTAGSIAYDVPEGASESYTCSLVLNVTGGPEVEDSATAMLLADYDLVMTVGPSPYLSGAFKPGETLDISYRIIPRGLPSLPMYRLTIMTTWSDSTFNLLTANLQGTVQMQIPADAADGGAYLLGSLYDAVTDDFLTSSTSGVAISDNAGDWDTTIGDMQNETDLLQDELNEARDDLNTTNDGLTDALRELGETRSQLNNALNNLNATLNQLISMQENMDSIQDDLNAVDGEVNERPTTGAVAMYLIIAAVVFALVSAGLMMLMLRKRQ